MSKALDDFPLSAFGDQLVEQLNKAGINGGVSIVVTDINDGSVASTTNLEDSDDFNLLAFVVQSRADGAYTYDAGKEETIQ